MFCDNCEKYHKFILLRDRSPVNSPHKGQWRGALMFSLICVWINGVNNRQVGDLRRYRAHYNVTVMKGRAQIKHWTPKSHLTSHPHLSFAVSISIWQKINIFIVRPHAIQPTLVWLQSCWWLDMRTNDEVNNQTLNHCSPDHIFNVTCYWNAWQNFCITHGAWRKN